MNISMVRQFILHDVSRFLIFDCLFVFCVNILNILVTVTLQSSNSIFNFMVIVCSHEHVRSIDLLFLTDFSYAFKDYMLYFLPSKIDNVFSNNPCMRLFSGITRNSYIVIGKLNKILTIISLVYLYMRISECQPF